MRGTYPENGQQDGQRPDHLSRGKQAELKLLLLITIIVGGAELIAFAGLSWHDRIVILIWMAIVIVGLLGLAKYLVYSIKKQRRSRSEHGSQSRPIH